MTISDIALKIWAAQIVGTIPSRAQFHKLYNSETSFFSAIEGDTRVINMVNQLTKEIEANTALDGVICIFDQDFPVINPTVKAKGDRPYLLFYKGDISLLHHLNNNVAVIGHTSPSENIQKRERKIVSQLVKKEQVIAVSYTHLPFYDSPDILKEKVLDLAVKYGASVSSSFSI